MASVATAPAVKVARCKRCATILRKARTICPCCNLDVNAPPDEPPPASGSSAGTSATGAADGSQKKSPRPAAAKSGVKICPICMATVQETDMQDFQGKRVCAGCFERMQKTGASAAAPAPATEQNSGASGGGGGGGSMSIEAAATATSDLKSFAHLEEKLKKRLYRAKWVLVIFAAMFLIMGVLAVIGAGAMNNAMDNLDQRDIEARMARDPQFKKLTKEEREDRLHDVEKGKAIVSDLAWRAKLVGFLFMGIGLFFAVTFFLVNTYPFESSLIALIVWVLFRAYLLTTEGIPTLFGIVIVVAVFASLIDAVMAGTEINKLRAEKAASKRKPAPAK